MGKSILTSDELKALYLKGKTLEELSPIAGISPSGVWKRLHQVNTPMRESIPRGPWAKEKRGEEFLGSDGRYWVREISSTKRRGSKRRAVVVMEGLLGGPIPEGYVVHHKNMIPTDDREDNLELLQSREHDTLSRKIKPRDLHYKDLSEAYLGVNRLILEDPSQLSYFESTRGFIEGLLVTVDSLDCSKIDLAPLGYAKQKWGHLVKTYLDLDKFSGFLHLCEISKGNSIAFDFNRKTTGNGSCMREIILTRKNRKKPWSSVRIIWRATELQKRWAADLILLHHILALIPKSDFGLVEMYVASAYQSAMYVVPLVESVFKVKLSTMDSTKHPHWKCILKCNEKYYQADSPKQKLSPHWRMQDVANALREGKPFEPLTYKDFKLEV